MTTVHRVAWGALLLFGIFVVHESLQINYYGSDFGPGPGFFSFWLGALVILLAVAELLRTVGAREPLAPGFFPEAAGWRAWGPSSGRSSARCCSWTAWASA